MKETEEEECENKWTEILHMIIIIHTVRMMNENHASNTDIHVCTYAQTSTSSLFFL